MEPMTIAAVASAAQDALPKISQMLGNAGATPFIWTKQGVFPSGQTSMSPSTQSSAQKPTLDISSILKMIPGGQK